MVSCVNENNKNENENVASNELSKQTIKKAFDYENMLSEKYDNMKMNDIFKSDIPNEIWVGKTEEVDRRNIVEEKYEKLFEKWISRYGEKYDKKKIKIDNTIPREPGYKAKNCYVALCDNGYIYHRIN